jgi:ATP-dependent DNA helicase RecQ
MQEEIIQAVMDGHETLALLPTGGGKSICYQVPGMMLDGLTIVVTPLIALMKDQVDQLNRRGIRAMALYSGMSSREIDLGLDNCIFGQFKFLYISPERLQTEMFLARAERMNIALLAIDEAHCISQWGYDFRPPYLQIADFREALGIHRIIAVTATATKKVRADIQGQLRMEEVEVFQKSFARANLSYSVFETENKLDKLGQILQNVPGSSVVYVRSRKSAQQVSLLLNNAGIQADFYHAGLSSALRAQKQQQWINNQIRVIVSTNAFGMGIDKPDVRTVVHLDLPDSLEAYYQEAGRAGRDERKAYAVLLYQQSDLEGLRERTRKVHPGLDLIKRVYQALANRYKLAVGSGENVSFGFQYQEFVNTFDLPLFETHFALKKLESEGLIHISEGYNEPSKINLKLAHEDLYKFQVEHASLDPILKALLRLYGGEMHSDFVTIREDEVAKFLKTGKNKVIKLLEHLDQLNVVDYRKASFSSQVTFLVPRLDKDSLPIDAEQLKERLQIDEEKAQSMIEYATSAHSCRTRVLQAYFDEHTDQDCGVCDHCLNRKKQVESLDESVLLKQIPQEGIEVDELISLLKKEKELVTTAIRELVEKGKVRLVNESRVELI